MFCAGRAGPGTLVVDHAKAPGEKIRISGGGRCNFTNMFCAPENFLSANPHFAKSALSRYTPWDFIDLVGRHGIAWHEKTLGQLFCDGSAREIVAMLRSEMDGAGAELWLRTRVLQVRRTETFEVTVECEGARQQIKAERLVIATGGKSIPKMGATGLAYGIARQFGLAVTGTRAGLVPFTFGEGRFADLSGLAVDVRAQVGGAGFEEAMLFTHRGLSGPAMLQCSSYWREGAGLEIDLSPALPLFDWLRAERQVQGRRAVRSVLAQKLPSRLVAYLGPDMVPEGNLADQSDAALRALAEALHHWTVTPGGTEGYRTAEVTLGGVDTEALNARTMEAKAVPGLYFIGECVDVTGWLGGYNFQWAWASGAAAAEALRS